MRDYYYYGAANIPIAIVGFIINCLALYCLWKSNRGLELSNANRFLLALNLWDTFTCLVLIPSKCMYYMTTRYFDEQPKIFKYTGAINTYCSSFLITLIAFNRYLAVSRPFRHQTILTKERVSILLASALGVGLLIPTMVFTRLRAFGTLTFIVAILILCTILVLYCLILKEVNDSHKVVRSFRRNEERIPRRQARISFNVVILLTAYITCLGCFYGFLLNHVGKRFSSQSQSHIDIGILIFNMNSICNPVIYVLRSSSYRRVLKSLFGCRRHRIGMRNRVRRNRIAVLEQPQPVPVVRVR